MNVTKAKDVEYGSYYVVENVHSGATGIVGSIVKALNLEELGYGLDGKPDFYEDHRVRKLNGGGNPNKHIWTPIVVVEVIKASPNSFAKNDEVWYFHETDMVLKSIHPVKAIPVGDDNVKTTPAGLANEFANLSKEGYENFYDIIYKSTDHIDWVIATKQLLLKEYIDGDYIIKNKDVIQGPYKWQGWFALPDGRMYFFE